MAIVSSIWPIIPMLKSVSTLNASASAISTASKKDLRERYRIVSVDDEPFLHKKRLKELGFNIGYYSRIDEFEPGEQPRIFICDIMGVEPSAKYDGAWAMKEVRKRYPVAPIIAYSHLKPADARYQEARSIADSALRKSDEIDDLAEILDEMIKEINNFQLYWLRIEKYLRLENFSSKDIAVIEHYYVQSVSNRDEKYFQKASRVVSDRDLSRLFESVAPMVGRGLISLGVKSITGA